MIIVLVVGKPNYENMLDICLTARALGASSAVFTISNPQLISRLKRSCSVVAKKWGGNFSVQFTSNWKGYLESRRNYKTVHLTRYGIPVQKRLYTLRSYKNIIIAISTTKELKSMCTVADFNISITSQPHSSIAAMAIFLNQYFAGRELSLNFSNAKFKVLPSQNEQLLKRTK
ncbi:MAG: hypothetical protein QXN59_00100 [Candidatus Micrarchaeaceae archaeon]